MKIEIDTVKGFQDYFPPESLKRQSIRKIVEKWFELYGFSLVETPVIEFDELMGVGDDETVSDRFRLKDRGERNLGLRYEFTFQLARLLKQNPNLKMPFKRYQIGEVFRDEPIRQGRARQFTQCDVDIIGDGSVNADAECLALVSDILKDLGIKDYEIKINNRALLEAIIKSVEIEDIESVMRELDKLEKVGEDVVKANLRKYASANQILTLFKLLGKDLKFYKQNSFEGAEEIEDLMETCNFYGIKVRMNPTLVRGFGYYTGNVFEFYLLNKKTALVGGGRFDNLVGKYINKKIPAVGISFSFEALMGLCEDEISKLELEKVPKAVLISISQEKATIGLAKKLRKARISCTTSFDKPSKAMEYANSYGVEYVVFVGTEEVGKKMFKLKDMGSGEEKLVNEKSLVKILSKKI
jgi:histidyl-tRNA synthetase